MNNSQRVAVNTLAQYVRTIINMVLSLYTVRVVLLVLGEDDFGIYTLVAGVVMALSFVTNSLVTTTQRFVSYYQGKGDVEQTKKVFNNSLLIHIFLGLFVILVLEAISPFLFGGFLNIPEDRVKAASLVYQAVLAMLFMSFITSPYRALLISRENIVYISIVDVLDGVLKVIFATLLTQTSYDKLVFYGLTMALVQLFNFIALAAFAYHNYEECVVPHLKKLTRGFFFEMMSFAGWSIYSTGCIIGRQQGIAIVLNKCMGAAINASYGIAFQIQNYTGFLSSSLVNAMAPQIVKSEGAGNRQRALKLSTVLCKFMFFLLSTICIPCFFEIEQILQLWLKDVPAYAAFFCRMVMLAAMMDTLTIGLVHVNQAIGKIGTFSVVVNTPKLLTAPLFGMCLLMGMPLVCSAVVFVSVELMCSFFRLPLIRKTAGLSIRQFLRDTVRMEILPIVAFLLACFVVQNTVDSEFRFLLTFALGIPVFFLSIYFVGLSSYEKKMVSDMGRQILTRFRK